MSKLHSLLLAGAALAAGGAASAQSQPVSSPGVATDQLRFPAAAPDDQGARRSERREALFARLDANHDGTISAAEFAAADTRTGEHRGQTGQHRNGLDGAPVPPPSRFSPGRGAGEANPMADRVITRDAFAAMMMARFDRLDTNHDGQITPDERHGAPEGGMDRGGHARPLPGSAG